jgi:phosphoribosylanthranilate isomerase
VTRVKICGITNLKDALWAADAGADALGFVFAKSPRRAVPSQVRKIVKAVGPWITTVGVFVNEDIKRVRQIAAECGLDAVQLHGDESPDYVRQLKSSSCKIIKAFRLAGKADLKKVSKYAPLVDAFLFDAKVAGKWGGSGQRFDWDILKSFKSSRPFIVAGGLSPEDAGEVVRRLSPYGVEASSSVERAPGKKDPKKVKEFIRRAKQS